MKGGAKAITQKTVSSLKMVGLQEIFQENSNQKISALDELKKIRLNFLLKVINEQLTEKQRNCVNAVFFENITLAEYARRNGINKSTASRCYWRAMEIIRKFVPYMTIVRVVDDEV